MPAPDNTRRLGDALLTKTATLPNADVAATTTAALDLGPQPYSATENLTLRIATTEATGVNTKLVTITVEHSDTATSGFVAVPTLGTTVIEAAASKYPPTTAVYKLPPGLKRYVRLSAAGEAGGGNATDGTMTASIRA